MESTPHTSVYWQEKFVWIFGSIFAVSIFGVIGWGVLSMQKGRVVPHTKYENSEYQFSFDIPVGHTVSAFYEGDGQTVLVRNAQGVTIGQLHMYSAELSEPINPEVIQRDLKGTPVFDVRPFSASKKQPVTGVSFSFEDPSVRTASEIWFAYNQTVYQWTVAVGQEAVVRGIINSMLWR